MPGVRKQNPTDLTQRGRAATKSRFLAALRFARKDMLFRVLHGLWPTHRNEFLPSVIRVSHRPAPTHGRESPCGLSFRSRMRERNLFFIFFSQKQILVATLHGKTERLDDF